MTAIIILFLIALVLFFLEIFVPGGILAVAGLILIVMAGIVAFFDPTMGPEIAVVIVVGGLLFASLLLILEVKFITRSPLGQKLMHRQTNQAQARQKEGTPDLVGQQGVALTAIYPTGTVRLGPQTYQARSRDGLLERGTAVQVIRQDDFELIVGPVPPGS